MDTTAAPAGTWALRGITATYAICDHCGRTLARCFRIEDPTGAQIIVGRTCAKRLTGWTWTLAQAQRAEAIRLREVAAEETYGDLYRELRDEALREAAGRGDGYGPAMSGWLALRDGNATDPEGFARECLAARQFPA